MNNSNKDAKQSVDKSPRLLYVLELEPGHWHALADTLWPTQIACPVPFKGRTSRGGAARGMQEGYQGPLTQPPWLHLMRGECMCFFCTPVSLDPKVRYYKYSGTKSCRLADKIRIFLEAVVRKVQCCGASWFTSESKYCKPQRRGVVLLEEKVHHCLLERL